MGITEVLESHSQPLSNEEHYDLAQQLTKQQKEDEDKDRGTKEMQTKDLSDILSSIDTAAEKLCISTLTGNTAVQQKGAQEPCYTLIMKPCKKRQKNQAVEVTFFLDVF